MAEHEGGCVRGAVRYVAQAEPERVTIFLASSRRSAPRSDR
jgi:hypothetical protein